MAVIASARVMTSTSVSYTHLDVYKRQQPRNKWLDQEEMDMLKFDAQKYDYPSRRSVVYGKKGMVCTSQPLAAQAGLDIIKRGGNAVDAAIATAACMTGLEPTSNGIGSDAFGLVLTKGELHGLNASGRSPMAITAEEVKKQRCVEETGPRS